MPQRSEFNLWHPDNAEFKAQNYGGLAGTTRTNVTGRDYGFSSLAKNKPLLQSPLQASSAGNSSLAAANGKDFSFSDQIRQEILPHSPAAADPSASPAADPTMWQKFKTGVSNYGKDADGKYSAQGTPLIRDLTAVGGLGLGVASFLEQRKTAGLQRDALRHDIATAKEQRANRQAMADSWSRAWDK